jgi:hypothetical protein
MENTFLDVRRKLYRPTVEVLREALSQRNSFLPIESDLITYMAGFSHHEFAKSLLDEFDLMFVYNNRVLLDKRNQRFHVKALINNPMDLPCFDMNSAFLSNRLGGEGDLNLDDGFFSNSICWRNMDGSYISSLYEETKKLSLPQYHDYCKTHLIGLSENIFPCMMSENEITIVVHFAMIPDNFEINVSSVLDKVSDGLLTCHYNDKSCLSIDKLRENRELFCELSEVKWNLIDADPSRKAMKFFSEINANYNIIPYKGEQYDYLRDFASSILSFYIPMIKQLKLGIPLPLDET